MTGTINPSWERSTAIPRFTSAWTSSESSTTDELSKGKSRRASTAARATNGRYVSANPSSALKRSPQALRTLSTLSKSTSLAMNACGEVAFDRTMCSAVRRRILEKGTIWSPADRNEATDTVGAGAARATGGAGAAWLTGGADGAAGGVGADGAGGGAAARRASTSRSASSRVMRPPEPVPVTSDSLMPFSARSLRTIGESTCGPTPSPLLPAAGAVGAGAGCVSAGAGGGVGGGGGGGGAGGSGSAAAAAGASSDAADAAPSPITASFTPTSTVSPSGTRISLRTPAAGEGTSESTLSVETSNSGSSRSTASPTAFIQRVIVPSVTVSPSCGIITSANVQSPSAQREHGLTECLGQRGVRLNELRHFLGEGLPVHREIAGPELLGHPGATEVHAQDPSGRPVGTLLGDDLHDTLGLADDLRPAVAAVRVLLGHHRDARLLRLRLGHAAECDLGAAVDRPGNLGVVDRYHLLAQHG